MEKSIKDKLVDTFGSCFLCSNQIALPYQKHYCPNIRKTGLASSPIHSLLCLSRYLKLDLGKLLTIKQPGALPLTGVPQSQLTVSLCEMCAELNMKFSKLYRQLEKIQMEVVQCLELVNERLEGSVTVSKTWMPGKVFRTTDNSEEEWITNLEIVNGLRKDAVKKCAKRIATVAPHVRIQRVKQFQIKGKHPRAKLTSERISSNEQKTVPNLMISNIKTEPPFNDSTETSDNEHSDPHSPLDHLDEDDDPQHANWQAQNQSDFTSTLVNIKSESVSTMMGNDKLQNKKLGTTTRQKPYVLITTPLSKTDAGKPKNIFNKKTLKYSCNLCPADGRHFKTEYTQAGCRFHYRNFHLKEIVKCTLCKEEFPNMTRFNNHLQSFHLGIIYSCQRCKKRFGRRNYLARHVRNKVCG